MTQAASPTSPRLMLILPASPAPDPATVSACLKAGDVAAVIAGIGEGAQEQARVRKLMSAVQSADGAFLLDGRADMAAKLDADGAHLSSLGAFRASVGALKPARIAGAGIAASRHEAMEVGEAGADYVLFGGPGIPFPQVVELISWWAEVFEVPCVGLAQDSTQAEELARAGADFIALAGDWLTTPDAPARLADIAARVAHADKDPEQAPGAGEATSE